MTEPFYATPTPQDEILFRLIQQRLDALHQAEEAARQKEAQDQARREQMWAATEPIYHRIRQLLSGTMVNRRDDGFTLTVADSRLEAQYVLDQGWKLTLISNGNAEVLPVITDEGELIRRVVGLYTVSCERVQNLELLLTRLREYFQLNHLNREDSLRWLAEIEAHPSEPAIEPEDDLETSLGEKAAPLEAEDPRLRRYRDLADGLSDMVEGGRLNEGDIPDDYEWLVTLLARIAAADPGAPRDITDIRTSYQEHSASEPRPLAVIDEELREIARQLASLANYRGPAAELNQGPLIQRQTDLLAERRDALETQEEPAGPRPLAVIQEELDDIELILENSPEYRDTAFRRIEELLLEQKLALENQGDE